MEIIARTECQEIHPQKKREQEITSKQFPQNQNDNTFPFLHFPRSYKYAESHIQILFPVDVYASANLSPYSLTYYIQCAAQLSTHVYKSAGMHISPWKEPSPYEVVQDCLDNDLHPNAVFSDNLLLSMSRYRRVLPLASVYNSRLQYKSWLHLPMGYTLV